MIENIVVQKKLTDIGDYNAFWEKMVSTVVEELFQNTQHYISAYSFKPDSVLKMIVSSMKVVPIDVKRILNTFYRDMIMDEPDPMLPGTSVG